MYKPAQVELQLDRPQLPYSETFGPIAAGGSLAQRTIRKKGPYNKHGLEEIVCVWARIVKKSFVFFFFFFFLYVQII